jgi:hypothetical protein
MLFDLRGRGRRRTVQAIYLGLAILMGGGLVLFGIGSNSNGGGLFDAVLGSSNAGDPAVKTLEKRIDSQLAKTRLNPRDLAAWAEVTRLRVQRANFDGIIDDPTSADINYTTKGKQKLALASDSWDRYLALDPKTPDARVAKSMVQAYGKGALNQPVKAVRAMQIVTAAEDPPNSNLYAQLAQLAYTAGDNTTGDLAADRAVKLAPASERKSLRQALVGIKAQGTTPPATATPTPTG